ncbi:hypothetical protein PLESTB_001460200 [Pleodorina starrii]|uniref:Uncharacterized protein n=1 Tax=Pleodorina starrii TaxID=330485 RepID=A0A9W6F805_9CHLO|nr:hypothetical protein PLESTB_001460200 [Pleodorina starrii]GLC74753.1 hypothetical protein PLESTF_001552600 [Pleodorina starrii]
MKKIACDAHAASHHVHASRSTVPLRYVRATTSVASRTARGANRLVRPASNTNGEEEQAPSTSVEPVAADPDAASVALGEPVAASPNRLESLDDMAAFVERTRVEEENIRRKREEVELQLFRMRQQEAVRRQQAIKLRLASDRANAAVLREQHNQNHQNQQHQQQQAGGPSEGQAATHGSVAGPAGAEAGGGSFPAAATGPAAPGDVVGAPVKKKLMLKKSKRMSAVAAAAGLHRVSTPTSAVSGRVGASGTHGTNGSGLPLAAGSGGGSSGGGGGVGKALLSREELIGREKRGKEGGGGGGVSAGGSGAESCDPEEGCNDFAEVVVPKPIFIISDCTGESAARTVRAALNQFEVRCRTQAPAQIMIYRFVESTEKMMSIINEAAKEDALVVYTLVDPKAVKLVQTACKLGGVRYVDLWTALLDTMEVHLNAVRSGVPASLAEVRKPTASLTDEYFRMIEAVEYTRKMDDGAHPQEWVNADLVILGVSRCGKTPLSIYLGQRGYKVANLPLIPGCPVPRELHEIDQTRIVGLIIDPNVLSTIRRNRVSIMGVARAQAIDYAEVKKINFELDWARKLYNSHPEWPVIDVTLRGIEETAARILKLLNDRRGDASPKWVEAYHAKQTPTQHQQAAEAAEAAAARGGAGADTPYNVPEMIYGAHESTFLMQGLY